LSVGAAVPAGIGAAAAQTPTTLRLEPVTVFAGQFPTGERPGALLNSPEAVRTPGTTADINRTLQTLPGVQLPDEGNALFVRGGDSFETVTLVNGLRFPNATRLNAPAGNFAVTLTPFEARRIDFASDGFGARRRSGVRRRSGGRCEWSGTGRHPSANGAAARRAGDCHVETAPGKGFGVTLGLPAESEGGAA